MTIYTENKIQQNLLASALGNVDIVSCRVENDADDAACFHTHSLFLFLCHLLIITSE